MEHEMEVNVEVISNEMVKPSLPTTSHPKIFTLCSLDQTVPAIHIPVLLIYTGHAPTTPTPQANSLSQTLDHVKASLSQTLDQFYPLSGRFLDESTVSCNDQGIPYIQTRVDCNLSDVIAPSHDKVKLLTKFLPPQELQTQGPHQPISQSVPLAFQVNAFLCGGVVIGCYMLHKLLDAVSLGVFFKHWSSLASRRDHDTIQPDYEATINVFPPLYKGLEHVFVPNIYRDINKHPPCSEQSNESTTVVVKSFTFTSVALSNLRAKAASKLVPTPTRFEALVGFLWEHLILATTATTTRNLGDTTTLSFCVNMRPRMRPPLPSHAMGNVVTNTVAKANKSRSSNLQDLVQEIHLALSHIDHKIRTVYQSENGAEFLQREREAEFQAMMNKDKGLNYQLSSWCNNGLNEADFGFGKPTSILPIDGRPLPPTLGNFIYFTDYRHPISGDNGIEIWVFLGVKQMQVLESIPHFLAFASPN